MTARVKMVPRNVKVMPARPRLRIVNELTGRPRRDVRAAQSNRPKRPVGAFNSIARELRLGPPEAAIYSTSCRRGLWHDPPRRFILVLPWPAPEDRRGFTLAQFKWVAGSAQGGSPCLLPYAVLLLPHPLFPFSPKIRSVLELDMRIGVARNCRVLRGCQVSCLRVGARRRAGRPGDDECFPRRHSLRVPLPH